MKPPFFAFLGLSALLVFLVISAPVLKDAGYVNASNLNYLMFSSACHQISERSLHVFGAKMAVCARCFGIYAGMLIGCLLYPFLNRFERMPPGWVMLAAIASLALDGVSQLFGLRESSNILRVLTGLLFGGVIPYYLIPGFNLIYEDIKRLFISGCR